MIKLFVFLHHRNHRYGNVHYDKTYKYEILSLPYKNLLAHNVIMKNKLDADGDLELCFSGFGSITLEFKSRKNLQEIYATLTKIML
jgi:hypothetical protein